MRLKSLKLAGFKSFANPTTFTFKHDITAIVGPNGCGKSNVIDAIRWVLGETSAKQLRGGAMSDVIFAGVEGRAAKSLASVELTFEHTQDESTGIRHALNLYQELTLRRQITKEGKSDYFINGSRVRRRDVVDVFLGTGLGSRSYAVIEQGMIGRIVDSSPMQLREFIEEGAGVSRYQARREETQKKLTEAQDNLDRLNDLQGELQKQHKNLQRQAESAKQYQALNEALVEAQKQDLLRRIYDNHQYHQAKEQEHQQSSEQLAQLEKEVAKTRSEMERLSAKVAEGQWLKDDARDKYHDAQMAEQAAGHNFYTANQQMSQYDDKIARLKSLHDEAVQATAQSTQELAVLDDKIAKIEPSYQAFTQSISATQAKLEHAQGDWQQANSQVMSLTTQKDTLANTLALAQSQQQRVLNNREKWMKKHNELVASEQALGDDVAEKARLDELSQKIQILTLQIQELEDNQEDKQVFDTLDGEVKALQAQVASAEKRHAVLSGEYDVLHKLVYPPKATPSPTTDDVDLSHLPKLKDVISLSTLGKQYAGVLDGVLGFWLDAYVSDDVDYRLVASTPSKTGASAVFKTVSAVATLDDERLIALAKLFDKPTLGVFEHWYLYTGELSDDAIKTLIDTLTHQVIVTSTGWIVGAFGVLHISRFGAESSNFLSQKAEHLHRLGELEDELYELENELDGHTTKLKQHTAKLDAQKIIIEEKTAQLTSATNQLRQHQQEYTKLNTKVQTDQVKRDNFAKNKAMLDDEKNEIQQELKSLELEIAQTKQRLDEHLPIYEKAKLAITALTSNVDELQAQLKATQEQYQALQIEHHTLTQSRLHTLNLQKLANKNAEQTTEDIKATKQAQEQMMDTLPKLEQLFKDAKAQSALLKISSEEHEAAAKALQLMQVKLQEDLTQAHEKYAQAQAQSAQIVADAAVGKSRLEDLNAQMLKLDESFNLASVLADFRTKTPKFADTTAQIDELTQKITKLGAVNLAAAAELEALESRVSPMQAQIDDINDSVAKLQDAIKAIDEKTKTLFLNTLQAVNAELNTLFAKVFGGGQASLTLLDDDSLSKADKWRAGLVLMAQPKGKKNSRLAVLSGGEKTLTALSLIFAIFKQHPAPFCVLDEVDAPLDDANVGRFTSLIHELADSVQFIFISHNKLAMQTADELKGITMPTAGVSSLVTVSLEEAEQYLQDENG